MQMLLVQGPYFKRNTVLGKIQIFMAPEKLLIMKAGEETKLHLKLQNNNKNPPQTTTKNTQKKIKHSDSQYFLK